MSCRLRMILTTTELRAHTKPAATARRLLCSPRKFQGPRIDTRPARAKITAPHCSPRTGSPRIGQASISSQKGMVYARIDTLPAPPRLTAHMANPTKPPVCNRPKMIVRPRACGSSRRCSRGSRMNMKTAPKKVRSAAKVKGSAYCMPTFITTQLYPQTRASRARAAKGSQAARPLPPAAVSLCEVTLVS